MSLAPSFEQHDVGLVGHGPGEPLESARGRVARNAGIHDHDIVTPVAQCLFPSVRGKPGRDQGRKPAIRLSPKPTIRTGSAAAGKIVIKAMNPAAMKPEKLF